ncbi:DUF1217 domain-containing protein (plasmid) [Rhizobium sp. TRM96647]|uniref:DUF1217 domain-containing protein n=1 Tax=unclassified Rhizobium TaxID=2613769 RepID=UPI0021E8F0CB|nr:MULTISPECIES: DUF1217 domain-containing protein [unclassified Rhizobium]MCV3735455.1 DUF1217 domain-containing protein [Rhizobium sp. TRM96647]MCV3757782.1 DUF1217 domain-containing protein [Rhizobium sp. TRM96650]
MLSTYTSYNLVTRDLLTTLNRKSEETINAREAQYYRDNIGKVSTVDEFLGDYRLFNYAMKAYGLDDMAYATAFMRQVLESDLSDENSFVNRLTDTRYREFAQAFSFAEETAVAQSDAQMDDIIGLYTAAMANAGAVQTEETRYYNIVIDSVTNVDQLLNNDRLRDYMFSAFDIDPETYSREKVRGALTSDLDDPNSYVNTTFGARITELSGFVQDARAQINSGNLSAAEKASLETQINRWNSEIVSAGSYLALAAAYEFSEDGTLPAGTLAQTAEQKTATNEAYIISGPRLTSAGALLNQAYFEEAISSITTVDELLADSRLKEYIRTAFDLNDVTVVNATLENILTDDPDDPAGYIQTFGGNDARYIALNKAFNFQADGTLTAGDSAQTAAQTASTGSNYMSRYNDKDDEADEKLISRYKIEADAIETVADFFSSTNVYDLALQAFGLDPDAESTYRIKQVLLSDLNDPKSYANRLGDERYIELAKAFNFDADGNIEPPTLAQSEAEIQVVTRAYVTAVSRFGTAEDKEKAEEEASYYAAQMQSISSVEELLADERLVNVILKANGVDPETVPEGFMEQIFASNLDDPQSFANQQAERRYRAIVASFNFNADGLVERPEETAIQSRRGIYQTIDNYIRQAVETDQGAQNPGVRLALYFERKAPTLSSAYDILADDALYEVFKTSFGISDEVGNADIDAQAEMIKRQINLEDLQDPEYVKKMIVRFAVLYDLENNTQTSSAATILAGGTQSISADTLLSMAQLRAGGA